jgi:hypothetical protein
MDEHAAREQVSFPFRGRGEYWTAATVAVPTRSGGALSMLTFSFTLPAAG